MLYIVRTGPPYFDIVLNSLKSQIPSQSVIYNTGDNFYVLKNNLRYSPVFGKYYLVILNYKKDKELFDFIKWAVNDTNYIRVVLYTNNKTDFTNAQQRAELCKINPKIYDNYRASSGDKDIYISNFFNDRGINISYNLIKVIRGRLRGYSIEVSSYLEKVSRLEKITASEIRKAIPSKSTLNANSFGYSLFSEDYCERDFHKLLLEYQYSPKILYNSLNDYLDKLLKIYKVYLTGEFSEVNYKTFVLSKGSKFGVTSEYHARSILDIFSRFSYPKLMLIKSLLNDVDSYSKLSYIITLYKVIGICCRS